MASERELPGKVRRGFFGLGTTKGACEQRPSKVKDIIDSNEAVKKYGGAVYTTYPTKKKATEASSNNSYYRYGQILAKNENSSYNYNYNYKFTAATTKEDTRLRMLYN